MSSTVNAPARSRGWIERVGWLLVVAGALAFLVRGPLRATNRASDLRVLYLGAKAWVEGVDPYQFDHLIELWHASGGSAQYTPAPKAAPLLYPPTTFPLIAPLTLTSFPVALYIVTVALVALFAATVGALFPLAGVYLREPRGIFLLAGILLLAPVHTGMSLAQITMPSALLAILAVAMQVRGRGILAGVCLGVATCLKPQLGGVFGLFLLACGSWRSVLIAGVVVGVDAAIAVGYLAIHEAPWLESLKMNWRTFDDPTGVTHPGTLNELRHQMLNLEPLLIGWSAPPETAEILAFGITGILLSVWLVLTATRGKDEDRLLQAATLGVLALLPVYHRFYDATLLMLVIAWLCSPSARCAGGLAVAAALLCLPFALPGAEMLARATNGGLVPAVIADAWWWRALAIPHQNVALLALGVVLLAAMARRHPSRAVALDARE